jgi:hypothetical protein
MNLVYSCFRQKLQKRFIEMREGRTLWKLFYIPAPRVQFPTGGTPKRSFTMIALAKCHVQRPLPQLSSLGEDATTVAIGGQCRSSLSRPSTQSPDLADTGRRTPPGAAADHSVLGTAPHLWPCQTNFWAPSERFEWGRELWCNPFQPASGVSIA